MFDTCEIAFLEKITLTKNSVQQQTVDTEFLHVLNGCNTKK